MPPKSTKKSTEDKYVPTAWGSNVGVIEDLKMPSGQVAQVRRPGVDGLMKAGVLRNLDVLSAVVDEKHVKRMEGQPDNTDALMLKKLMDDPEKLAEVMHVVDRVVVHCVLKPEVKMTPNDITSREPGVIYCDMIELEDRMFIFNYAVGGTRDVETFRRESEQHVASVDDVQDVDGETQ